MFRINVQSHKIKSNRTKRCEHSKPYAFSDTDVHTRPVSSKSSFSKLSELPFVQERTIFIYSGIPISN
jgi:hypothetical protein